MNHSTQTPSAQSVQTAQAIAAILAGRKARPESRQTAQALLRIVRG